MHVILVTATLVITSATSDYSDPVSYSNRPTYADYERERRWRESIEAIRRHDEALRDFVRAAAVPPGRLHADPDLRIESPIVTTRITSNEHRLRWLRRARGARRERKPRRRRIRTWERSPACAP